MDKEYNELKSKSLEAEQEFKLAQSKVSDAKEQLTKLRKDLDGKILSLYIFYSAPGWQSFEGPLCFELGNLKIHYCGDIAWSLPFPMAQDRRTTNKVLFVFFWVLVVDWFVCVVVVVCVCWGGMIRSNF